MDSITQAALGGLCGELVLRKQLGWRGMAWGLLFGTLPDLDMLAYLWLEPVERLGWHRGLSHSLLCCVLAAVGFGWLLSRLHRKRGVRFRQAAGFVFLTWFTHVLIDCFTSYGTQIFEPFSSQRVALNNMSIVDVAFTTPMLLGLLVGLFFRKDSATRTAIGRSAAVWLCLYVAASFTLKYMAGKHFTRQLAARGIKAERMMTSPTFSNIFLWRMLAESGDRYYVAYWSLFDSPDRPEVIASTAKGHDSLGRFLVYPETEKLVWFAMGWHKVLRDPAHPDSVLFVDMRFPEMVSRDSMRPVFVWRVAEEADGVSFRQVSFRGNAGAGDVLGYQWQRVMGGAPGWLAVPWPWERPGD